MRARRANEQLLALLRNAFGNVRSILVQEGVWAAVPGAPQSPHGPNVLWVSDRVGGREVVREYARFHRHDPEYYLNTLEALYCASLLMDPQERTLLLTHDLQLRRAAFDLRRVCPDCEIVIPAIRGIDFVPGGAHPQASSKLLYKLVELFLSRPRDYLGPVPNRSVMALVDLGHARPIGAKASQGDQCSP